MTVPAPSQITQRLAAFAAALHYDALPPEVPLRASDLVTDLVGSIVRAGAESNSTPALLAMAARLSIDGPGEITVFGFNRRYTPATAALFNGMLGHSLDFDDTHSDSSTHPSAPVVPAALAAAEMTGCSGREALSGIVAGYEVMIRIGNALDPTAHYARGFHPTATAGVFGAAAAAGRIFGLDAQQIASAFGVAASQAAGSLQFLVNGAWNKRFQVGAAAMNGLIAASLAREGFLGAADAIEGKHGLLVGYTDGADPERAVAGLGSVWETMNIGLKPYPTCRYTHAAIDGLVALRTELGLTTEQVKSVTVGLHRNGITLTGTPLEEKRRVRGIVEGQFSMPFAAAVALTLGRFGWDDYALLAKPEIDALCDRVDVIRDESLEGLRHPFGATLEVTTPQGTISRRIPDPSGEPDTFPSPEALSAKFMTLARPVLNDDAAMLHERLSRLADMPTLRELGGQANI
ncbi:MmgE/PrpD family protein [Neoaquamicrobium sediminum]|uniref:MmgE/PrpD family protein n=1 Tax=Neoaquamicrobium sediminum TaxID=1849104 RepID=UPI0015674978|nr:MmgE/PrpD family protein [Mesorhizobium sediminum]NRC56956.1 MmgE/PrpD family protein [Mesorhizobium sediminum]